MILILNDSSISQKQNDGNFKIFSVIVFFIYGPTLLRLTYSKYLIGTYTGALRLNKGVRICSAMMPVKKKKLKEVSMY